MKYSILFFLAFTVLCVQVLGQNDIEKKAEINIITELTKLADSEKYGFTQEMPVKVGKGKTGPANQRDYLSLLRDAQGNPITYERVGSCCDYKTPNGLMGFGRLDKYEITYRNEKNKKKTAIVYITFYDYEEPLILHGFKTL